MLWAKQSTAKTVIVGPILDSTGAEYASAVVGDLSLSKAGATLTALASAATLTYIANGQYTLVFTTGNLDTLGTAQVLCNKSTYQMPTLEIMVLPATVYDALVTNATTAAGGLGDIQRMAGTALTARDIGASVLLSSGTGTGQLDFTSGVVKANATQWLGGTIPAVNVTGVPLVDAKYLLGTIFSTPTVAGIPNVNVKTWNDLATVALPLVPTVAGRTLDVSATGEAGLDWANVGSPTTSLALTGTTIATTQKVDVETVKTRAVTAAGAIVVGGFVGQDTAAIGVNASGHVSRVALTDTVTTYTGDTPQTGDSFARIGATGSGLTSLAPSSTALSTAQWTHARAGYLENINVTDLVATRSDVFVRRNTAQGGSTAAIQFDGGASSIDNFYQWMNVRILSGTGAEQVARITAYNGTNKSANATFFTAPDNTSVFAILPATQAAVGWVDASPAQSVATVVWLNSTRTLSTTGNTGVWAAASRTLTAGTNIQLPSNGLANVTAWTVAITGNLSGSVGSVTGLTASDVGAIKAKTDNLPVSPAAVGSAMALTTGERTSVADALLGRNIAGGSDGGRTVKEAFYALRNKTDMTLGHVYAVDDTTVAWSFVVTTDASVDPVVSIDPS